MGWLWKLAGISRRQRKKKWWYQTKIKWNRLTMSKRTYSKEEVMYDRQQSVSKTGNNGRNSVMQSHRRQPTSKDGRVKRKKEEKRRSDAAVSVTGCSGLTWQDLNLHLLTDIDQQQGRFYSDWEKERHQIAIRSHFGTMPVRWRIGSVWIYCMRCKPKKQLFIVFVWTIALTYTGQLVT